MKKKSKIITFTILLIVIISNTPPLQYFLLPHYHYRNKDNSFSFTEEPGKGLDFKVCMKPWERYKQQNAGNQNMQLYRTFPIRFYAFWEWGQYLLNSDRLSLPYLVIS